MITTLVATTRVAYTGAVNKTLTFGMQDSEIVVENIDGLGPVKATIIRTDSATQAGTNRLSAKDDERSLIITFGFAPRRGSTNTVETLRRSLKNVFMPKTIVDLEISDTLLGTYIIKGSVETHEPSIFSKDPQVVVSILCTDPYFYKKNEDVVFNIPEPTNNSNHLAEFFTMTSEAEVPIGFVYEGIVRVNMSHLVFRVGDWPVGTGSPGGENILETQVQARVDYPFLAGDVVRMSSIRGQLGVTRVRSGANPPTVDLIPYFSGSLSRLKLAPGLNGLRTWPVSLVPGGGPNRYYRPLRDAKITYNKAIGGF